MGTHIMCIINTRNLMNAKLVLFYFCLLNLIKISKKEI